MTTAPVDLRFIQEMEHTPCLLQNMTGFTYSHIPVFQEYEFNVYIQFDSDNFIQQNPATFFFSKEIPLVKSSM